MCPSTSIQQFRRQIQRISKLCAGRLTGGNVSLGYAEIVELYYSVRELEEILRRDVPMDPVDRVQVVESAENLRADNAHPFRGLFPPRPDYVVEAPYCQLRDDD